MKLRFSGLAWLAGLALLAGQAAHAVENLTGTYEGKLKCNGTDGGITSKVKQDVTVEVLDSGASGLTFDIVSVQDTIVSFVVADGKKPQKGILAGASCAYSVASLAGAVVRLEVSSKAGSDKADLKGTVLFSNAMDDATSECTLDVKRVSTAEPSVNLCVI